MWVVLFHAYAGRHFGLLESWLPVPARAVLDAGHLGVQIFFVLSGFVISYSVSRYRVDARFIGRFALRRSIRLDPPYWMSISLLCLGSAYAAKRLLPDKVVRFPDARVPGGPSGVSPEPPGPPPDQPRVLDALPGGPVLPDLLRPAGPGAPPPARSSPIAGQSTPCSSRRP